MSRSSLQLSLFILKGKTFSYWIFKPQHVSVCVKDIQKLFFFKWAIPGLFFVYFRSFLVTISIQIEKTVDGMLGI